MHEISFTVEPCVGSNDHQVRVIIDGHDLIARVNKAMLGIDPPEFFADRALSQSGDLIFARCNCGVVGCGDGTVRTSRDDSTVTWSEVRPAIPGIESFLFSRRQFDAAIHIAKNDFSWETTERRAERLINGLNFTRFNVHGLAYRWASGRLDQAKISVCFILNSKYQVIVHAPWTHNTVESAIHAIEQELKKAPNEWSDVEIILPPAADFPSPHLRGPGWQRK
ncbi:MAG: hypothetical protein K8T25_04695 [Planctomycetia bacterium]|nr:hypothetical protein [Planctomycetia bacterium]